MSPSLLESIAPIFYDTVSQTVGWDSWLESGSVQARGTIDCVRCLSQKENNVHSNGKRVQDKRAS